MIPIIRDGHMGADGKLRMTRQRRVILEVVKVSGCHPTAEEVYRRVRRRLPRIGLATVYRNLERLAEVGALQRVELGRGQMRFECRPEPHAHVRCTRCGCVRDAPEALLPAPERFPRSWNGFRITGYCVQLLGVCPDCRRKARPAAPPRARSPRRGKRP